MTTHEETTDPAPLCADPDCRLERDHFMHQPCIHARPGAFACSFGCFRHEFRPAEPVAEALLTMRRDEFRSVLAEGFHTAFRKSGAMDDPMANVIWHAIAGLPPAQWAHVIDWMMFSMMPADTAIIEFKRAEITEAVG